MTTIAAPAGAAATPPLTAVRLNWRVYTIEGVLLGAFMVSACCFTVLLEHPASPVRQHINSSLVRRALIGLAMAATALCLVYSPWGKRSGPHMNPAMTLSFLRLGRIGAWDAVFYVAGQFLGAAAGVLLVSVVLGMLVAHPAVNYAATTPGKSATAACAGEFSIAFIMMSVVMMSNRSPRLAPLTGCFAAALVALYITFEAPVSGMSLNPARSFGSAIFAHTFSSLWIYFSAPATGMLASIELQRLLGRRHHTREDRLCGKLTHSRHVACFLACDCLKGKTS
jgi:aquaporin Z